MYSALKNERKNITAWREITGPKEVEDNMVDWCKLHFEQESGTLLSNSTWESILTNNEVQDKLFYGKYTVPDGYTEDYQEFISSMKLPPNGQKN